MNSIVQSIKKPFNFIVGKFHSKSETQKHVSPSELTSRRANVFNSILSPFETYVVSFQSLLIWERPFLSAAAFLSINIAYWLIVSWNRRLFSILSIFSVIWFGYRTWINLIWPEIRAAPEEGDDTESWISLKPGILSVPEVSQYLNDFCEKMLVLWKDVWKLRKENHGLFCALMCGFFSILALIGKIIPGVLIIYTLVLILSLGPGIALHLIPSTLYDQIVGFFSESDSQVSSDASKCGGNSDKDSDIEEFAPEAFAEALRELKFHDLIPEVPSPGMVLTESGEPENSLLSIENSINEVSSDVSKCGNKTDKDNDIEEFSLEAYAEALKELKFYNLIPEVTSPTELDEPDNSLLSIGKEADELALYQGLGAFPSVEEEAESDLDDAISESDIMPSLESENNEMHFVPSHFKEDSSESESEAVFTEGLSFAKNAEEVVAKNDTSENKGIKKDTIVKRKRSSSSDLDDDLADFEILEESDVLS